MSAETEPTRFFIGADEWPGISKLIEECGEVVQVAGKLLATQGDEEHWDGTDLRDRLVEELADLSAAIDFVKRFCLGGQDNGRLSRRAVVKADLFAKWHREQSRESTP